MRQQSAARLQLPALMLLQCDNDAQHAQQLGAHDARRSALAQYSAVLHAPAAASLSPQLALQRCRKRIHDSQVAAPECS